jgi:phenylalanyl-tRNA synthetase alpha chain
MFHQIEGLFLDKNITMANLKYVLEVFLQKFFDSDDIEIRLRPSFFPFTEPSMEVDIRWKGDEKWLEVMGCGMVHPNVLANCGVKNNLQGFAFGLGLERFAMLKYKVHDLRDFFHTEDRWLQKYGA